MRAYSVSGPSESGTGPKTAITVISGNTTVRPCVYDVAVGSSTTPADQTFQLQVNRFTAAGTTAASAPTPQALDPGDVAAVATTGWTHSAEPTYNTSPLLDVSINQRATFRWVAAPGSEFKAPATTANGIGVKNHLSSAALVIRATALWTE